MEGQTIQDILNVAGGNKELKVSVDKTSLIWMGIVIFVGVCLAVLVAGLITKNI